MTTFKNLTTGSIVYTFADELPNNVNAKENAELHKIVQHTVTNVQKIDEKLIWLTLNNGDKFIVSTNVQTSAYATNTPYIYNVITTTIENAQNSLKRILETYN